MEGEDGICGGVSKVSINVGKGERKKDDMRVKPEEDEQELWSEKLKLLQCPFCWEDLNEIVNNDKTADKHKGRITQTEEKLEETDDLPEFLFTKLILNIVLIYAHFCDGDTESSLEALRATEALLESSSSRVEVSSKLVTDIEDALRHVVLACGAHVHFYSRNLGEVERTFSAMTKFGDLNDACKAGIFGVRAAVLIEYGYAGNVASMKHVEAALSLDPDQAQWHFFLGTCLRKMRRFDASYDIPAKEELKAFEEAYKIVKNPVYVVFLAQAYMEAAFRVFSEQHSSGTVSSASEVIGRMNKRSVELFKEALELRPDCLHIVVRCIQGFMKLPFPHKDLALAKECLNKALKRAPNNLVLIHTAAMFYERHENNFAEAKKYYQQANALGVFGSHMDLIRLRYSQNNCSYYPITDLEITLQKYQHVPPYRRETIMQMGSYHLFINGDIENAFKCWKKVIDEDPDTEKLKTHKSLFLHMLKPINVYEVLCDEARLAMQSKPDRMQGKESLYRKIITKCLKHYPACCNTSPLPRRKMVLAEVGTVSRGRFRQRLRGRGRGRGGEREGEGARDECVGGEGRAYRGGERGRGYRGAERGRGQSRRYRSRDSSVDTHHEEQTSDRQGSPVDREKYGNNYVAGSYNRGYRAGSNHREYSEGRQGEFSGSDNRIHKTNFDGRRCSRDSSTDNYRRHYNKERPVFHENADDNRTCSTNYEGGRYSRDSSTDNYRRHYNKERPVFRENADDNRTSSTNYEAGRYSRDSSTDGYRRHYNKERPVFRENGGDNRTSSTNYEAERYSRDSSTDGYRRHYNKERPVFRENADDNRTSSTNYEAGRYMRKPRR